jgi:hypothetical protein
MNGMRLTVLAVMLLLGALPLALAEEVVDPNHDVTDDPVPTGNSPVTLPVPGDGGWSDDFNRSPGTDMGPDWTEYVGDMAIIMGHGFGNMDFGWSYMLHNFASADPMLAVMHVDLLPPSGISGPHVALIAGADPSSTLWFYTKIQDNNTDGSYDRIYYYSSGNGEPWGSFFTDITPFTTARVTMYFTQDGHTLNVDIDSDFDGNVDEHFENTGAMSVTTAGTGFGIGTWAAGAYDNWEIVVPDVPDDPDVPAASETGLLILLVVLLLCSAAVILRRRQRAA